MGTINGIPSADKIRKQLGRVGLSDSLKVADPEIYAVISAVEAVQGMRSAIGVHVIPYLRAIRRACIAWKFANFGRDCPELVHINRLLEVSDKRLMAIIEHNFAKSKTQRAVQEARDSFRPLFDQVLLQQGNGVGRALDGPYNAIERASRTHVGVFAGTQAMSIYEREKQWTGLDFDDWLMQVLIPRSEDDPHTHFYKTINSMEAGILSQGGVKYCNPQERAGLIIKLESGLFKNAKNELYHTGSKETGFNGHGWAIYVVDFDNTFYSESHILNEFHHSSFLSGKPVQAAGEIAVDRGKIVAVTNKTGHYKAGPAELSRTLELLAAGGVDLNTVAVNDPFLGHGQWFSARTVLAAKGNVSALSPESQIPKPPTVAP